MMRPLAVPFMPIVAAALLIQTAGAQETKKGMQPPSSSPNRQATGAGVASGSTDTCLIGSWRSESVVLPGLSEGGAGIVLTIKRDGTEMLDYSGMQPLKGKDGTANTWGGKFEGRISAAAGTATDKSVTKYDLTTTFTPTYGPARTGSMAGPGPAGLGSDPNNRGYVCGGATLTFQYLAFKLTFKRETNTR